MNYYPCQEQLDDIRKRALAYYPECMQEEDIQADLLALIRFSNVLLDRLAGSVPCFSTEECERLWKQALIKPCEG